MDTRQTLLGPGPVSGEFSPKQRRAYQAVLQSQEQAINMVRPGVRYRDIHMAASQTLTEFLVDEQLLLGSPEDLVMQGAHALFFPHGIGHLLGLDVHDMENFGDKAAYAKGRTRSPQFGTGYLRMDMDLEPNMVVTIEPGLYICPAIFADPTSIPPSNMSSTGMSWSLGKDLAAFALRMTSDVPQTNRKISLP